MNAIQRGINHLLLADSVKVTLASDAVSGSVLNIPAADMSKLYVGALVLVKSSVVGTAANDLKVCHVYAIDSTLHRASIEPTLPATPKATDELRLGVTHWLKGGTLLRYEMPAYSAPVQELGDAAAAHEVAVLYGEQRARHILAAARESTWEIRAISKSPRHAQGCAERIARILHGHRAEFQAVLKGATVGSLQVYGVERNHREDALAEYQTRATVYAAAKAV